MDQKQGDKEKCILPFIIIIIFFNIYFWFEVNL